MMFSPFVKTTYLEIFFFFFQKTREKQTKTTPECALFQIWDNLCWSVSFREAADHPATFTKINVPRQMFLCFIIGQMVSNWKKHMCFFAFSGNFIRFSENEFSKNCSGHYSVKCHAWKKVQLLSYESKSQLDCKIFLSVVSL